MAGEADFFASSAEFGVISVAEKSARRDLSLVGYLLEASFAAREHLVSVKDECEANRGDPGRRLRRVLGDLWGQGIFSEGTDNTSR